MNDKTSTPLSELMQRINAGISKVGKKPPQKADSEDVIVATKAEDNEPQADHTQSTEEDPIRATPDEHGDDLVDVEFTPIDEKKGSSIAERLKGMGKGQKALVAVLIVAGALAAKNQFSGKPVAPTTEAPATTEEAGMPFAPEQTEANAPLPAKSFEDMGLESEKPQTGFDVNAPMTLGDKANPPVAPAAAPAVAANAATPATTPPMFGGEDEPFGKPPVPAKTQSAPAPSSIPATQSAEAQTSDAAPAATEENPFGSGTPETKPDVSGFAPGLSGTPTPNLDSRKPVLESAKLAEDVAGLKSQIAARDKTIERLQGKLDAAEKKLADDARKQLPNKAATRAPSQHARTVVRKPATAAPRSLVQRTPVRHSAALPAISKAPVRPRLCVAAVAQAARYCSTCVPHAFVTHNGQETMVGQGDYIDGMRVSIQGDRLDLQNSSGEVVHKFWSSPDGCKH